MTQAPDAIPGAPSVPATPSERRPRRRLVRLAGVMFLDGFRAAPGWMTAVTALLVAGGIASSSYPLGYRLLVDGALGGNRSQVAFGVMVVALLLGLAWVLSAIGATEAMALSDRIAIYRTGRLIELISGVPGLEHLERPDYLKEVERLNEGRRRLAAAPRQVVQNVSSSARIIALLVLLATVSPWLLLVPVAAAPPLICDRLAKRITKRSEDDMAADRRLAAMIFELSSDAEAAGELRSYGLSRHLAGLHHTLRDKLSRRAGAEARQVLAVTSLGWILYAAGLMAAIAFVAVRASAGAISLGTVLMTVSLIRRSRTQLAAATNNSGRLVETLATVDRLFWLEDHQAAAVAAAGSNPAPRGLRSGITIRDLSFCYPGTERPVLSALSLAFPAGATIAIVGENGSGKTTLVKLLLGLYQPSAGEILVDDVPLASIAPDQWRDRCTAAFQDFARFSLPAVSSVGVGEVASHDSEPRALAALTRAGGEDVVSQLPDGLATYVGGPYTGGHNLSGGQWQKLALGRAMRSADPLLVVLDEPTASLDAQAEHELFSRYASLTSSRAAQGEPGGSADGDSDGEPDGDSGRGTITLLVSHRFSTVRMADLIVYLEDGYAIESGTHDALMSAGGRYAEAFTLQAEAYR